MKVERAMVFVSKTLKRPTCTTAIALVSLSLALVFMLGGCDMTRQDLQTRAEGPTARPVKYGSQKEARVPPIDAGAPAVTETATFALG